MAIELESLKTACYFRKTEPAALEKIIPFLFERKVPVGETILWEGESDATLYFIITGIARLFTTSREGREFVVRIAYGGDSINDEGIFSKASNTFSAAAMTPLVLYGLRYENIPQILSLQPELSSAIAEVFAKRQLYFSKLAVELVFKNATARLARLLLDREKMIREGAGGQKITQQEMASMIGTVREIVGRSLKELEGSGAIRIEHNRIIIRDKSKLLEMSSV